VNVKGSDDKILYGFCYNVRYARNKPEKSTVTLTDDRIASLDALGFDWRATAEAASVMNSNQSPTSYEPCSEVRKRKILSLSDISSNEMESAPNKKRVTKSFEQRLADLQAYKEEHGHTNVKEREDKSLYEFFRKIRQARKNSEKSSRLINDDRIASLDALGFDWSMNRTNSGIKSFEQRIEDLQAYKEKHGHVNVRNCVDTSLYNFCRNIRYTRNNPKKSNTLINNECIARLDALGFDWSIQEQAAN